jgi:Flp pilus assembly pilin Flp
VLRPSSSTRKRRLSRDTRGTTIVEYGLLLFVVLVICAVGLKVLGITLQHKFGAADKHMAGQGEQATASAGQAANAAGAASAAPKPDAIHKDPTNATAGGAGENEAQNTGGLPLVARFALVALGVIGAAAAFFAIAKNKPAG